MFDSRTEVRMSCKEKDLSDEQYKKELIQMIDSINSTDMLRFLHRMVKTFKEKWGV